MLNNIYEFQKIHLHTQRIMYFLPLVAALNMSRNSEAKPVLYFLGHLSMMFLVK